MIRLKKDPPLGSANYFPEMCAEVDNLIFPTADHVVYVSNAAYSRDMETLYSGPLLPKEFALARSTQVCGQRAFYKYYQLLFVRINEALRTVGLGSFYGCTGLRTLGIGYSIHKASGRLEYTYTQRISNPKEINLVLEDWLVEVLLEVPKKTDPAKDDEWTYCPA